MKLCQSKMCTAGIGAKGSEMVLSKKGPKWYQGKRSHLVCTWAKRFKLELW